MITKKKCKKKTTTRTNSHFPLKLLNFLISTNDENITFKMNSRFFKLHHVHSNLVKMSHIGEIPWS